MIWLRYITRKYYIFRCEGHSKFPKCEMRFTPRNGACFWKDLYQWVLDSLTSLRIWFRIKLTHSLINWHKKRIKDLLTSHGHGLSWWRRATQAGGTTRQVPDGKGTGPRCPISSANPVLSLPSVMAIWKALRDAARSNIGQDDFSARFSFRWPLWVHI